jgi:hypothetical protein
MTAHALLGASKAHRWMPCPGSIALEAGLPDTTSPHAEEGTRAHGLAALIIEKQPFSEETDLEMFNNVMIYVDYVRREAEGHGDHALLIEQRVDYSDVIGVPDSFGTSDAIILAGDTIKVIDLKYGMGVRVNAEENEQLMLYALGALETFGVTGHYTRAKLVIVQPRLDHISEWEVTVEELKAFGEDARWHAQLALDIYEGRVETVLRPSDKACKFCKAKATCPALLAHVQDSVGADFENLDADEIKTSPMGMGSNSLSIAMAAVPLVEDWCKAVRARLEAELLAGKPVSGWKLVQGRNGARKWANEADAEAKLKSMKLKVEEMYDLSLITPPKAEKLAKAGVIGPRQWPSLQGLIVQKPGPPSVAPESDKRPAWSPADDFQNLDEGEK